MLGRIPNGEEDGNFGEENQVLKNVGGEEYKVSRELYTPLNIALLGKWRRAGLTGSWRRGRWTTAPRSPRSRRNSKTAKGKAKNFFFRKNRFTEQSCACSMFISTKFSKRNTFFFFK